MPDLRKKKPIPLVSDLVRDFFFSSAIQPIVQMVSFLALVDVHCQFKSLKVSGFLKLILTLKG